MKIQKIKKAAFFLGAFTMPLAASLISLSCSQSAAYNVVDKKTMNTNGSEQNGSENNKNTSEQESETKKEIVINEAYFNGLSEDLNKTYSYQRRARPGSSETVTKTTSLLDSFLNVSADTERFADGDTISFRFTNEEQIEKAKENFFPVNSFNGIPFSVRVVFIDTPEAYTGDAYGVNRREVSNATHKERLSKMSSNEQREEYKKGLMISRLERLLSHEDTNFAKQLLAGKDIRVVSENWNNKSYDRLTGSVFFADKGQNNWKSLAVEMLKNGFTAPRFDKKEVESYLFYKESVEAGEEVSADDISASDIQIPYIIAGLHYGIANKKGFYSREVYERVLNKFKELYTNNAEDVLHNYEGINEFQPLNTLDDLLVYYSEHGSGIADATETATALPDRAKQLSEAEEINYWLRLGFTSNKQIKIEE
ncbi:hypothetical protein [Mycoplasma sp. Ms02]|uniref:hypothetical protein n=1 Tax=Mycoplasma sp. Ms02 TaxID=353851 RepID=UPI001C89BD6D|nr:hypothetical protein [Mycoplasma sp. Ms02]QZE12223.1 hypothetical protein K4L35_02670 [Mycoplasma sp. Ms02]